jgi:uncharacterized membrane-anchored protein
MPSQEQTYRPELLPRQGERNAWVFALLAGLALGLLHQQGVVPVFSWIFVIFLLVSALSISLGNWMDRRTSLRIAVDGVAFENGLRSVQLGWAEIKEVRIYPARWGEKIQVLGEQSHFSFNTLGELQFKGENRTKVGFAQGQEILKEILKASGLAKKQQNDQYAYYSRA